jgi:hypothetical protein
MLFCTEGKEDSNSSDTGVQQTVEKHRLPERPDPLQRLKELVNTLSCLAGFIGSPCQHDRHILHMRSLTEVGSKSPKVLATDMVICCQM